MGDHAVAGGVDVGQAGAHVLVDHDGAPCAGLSAGRDQQVGVGAHPDRDQDQVHLPLVGLAVAAGAVDLEAARPRRRGSADPGHGGPVVTSTPWAASSAWTRTPSSGSTVGRTSGSISTWVTFRPRTVSPSAISRPT